MTSDFTCLLSRISFRRSRFAFRRETGADAPEAHMITQPPSFSAAFFLFASFWALSSAWNFW